jgi:hypothetical protein
MVNDVTIDPRYSKYDNKDIERILDSVAVFDDKPTDGSDKPVKSSGVASAIQQAVENVPVSTEEAVRNIVKNYEPEPEPEPEEA